MGKDNSTINEFELYRLEAEETQVDILADLIDFRDPKESLMNLIAQCTSSRFTPDELLWGVDLSELEEGGVYRDVLILYHDYFSRDSGITFQGELKVLFFSGLMRDYLKTKGEVNDRTVSADQSLANAQFLAAISLISEKGLLLPSIYYLERLTDRLGYFVEEEDKSRAKFLSLWVVIKEWLSEHGHKFTS